MPVLGTQRVACLAKRIAMLPDAGGRAATKRRFLTWLEGKRTAAGEQHVRDAWGLDVQDCKGEKSDIGKASDWVCFL